MNTETPGRIPSRGLMGALLAAGGLALVTTVATMLAKPSPTTDFIPQSTTTLAATTTPTSVADTVTIRPADALNIVAAALDSWAAYAVSGNPDDLNHFHPDGPQYRSITSQQPPAATESYTIDFTPTAPSPSSATQILVTGTVHIEYNGRTTQDATWTIELRLHNDRWTVWTIEGEQP